MNITFTNTCCSLTSPACVKLVPVSHVPVHQHWVVRQTRWQWPYLGQTGDTEGGFVDAGEGHTAVVGAVLLSQLTGRAQDLSQTIPVGHLIVELVRPVCFNITSPHFSQEACLQPSPKVITSLYLLVQTFVWRTCLWHSRQTSNATKNLKQVAWKSDLPTKSACCVLS